jgi:hypothetical protein
LLTEASCRCFGLENGIYSFLAEYNSEVNIFKIIGGMVCALAS